MTHVLATPLLIIKQKSKNLVKQYWRWSIFRRWVRIFWSHLVKILGSRDVINKNCRRILRNELGIDLGYSEAAEYRFIGRLWLWRFRCQDTNHKWAKNNSSWIFRGLISIHPLEFLSHFSRSGRNKGSFIGRRSWSYRVPVFHFQIHNRLLACTHFSRKARYLENNGILVLGLFR